MFIMIQSIYKKMMQSTSTCSYFYMMEGFPAPISC